MSIDSIGSNSTINLLHTDDLVALEIGGEPAAVVANTLATSARDARDRNELERTALEDQLSRTEQQQIDAMHEQAEHIRAAGYIRGATMMASGVLGMAGSGMGLDAPSEGQGQLTANYFGSGAKVLEGAGQMLGASEDAAAKNAEADGAAAGNAARHLERRLEDVERAQSDAREQVQKAIDGAAQLVDTKGRTDSAMIFIRG